MKSKIWCVFALLCLAAMEAEPRDSTPASVPGDQVQWDHLVGDIKASTENDLLGSQESFATTHRNEHFFFAEAECSANAVALLNVNDLLPDRATTVKLRTRAAWSGKTAVLLLRGYSDGQNFMFLCLIDKDGRLERTRLIRPVPMGKGRAVEIDAARYKYGVD